MSARPLAASAKQPLPPAARNVGRDSVRDTFRRQGTAPAEWRPAFQQSAGLDAYAGPMLGGIRVDPYLCMPTPSIVRCRASICRRMARSIAGVAVPLATCADMCVTAVAMLATI